MNRLEAGVLYLEDACEVEEAEHMLELLQGGAITGFDLRSCRRLHTAVLQLLLAAQLPIVSPPADPGLAALLG
jgi:hypothetical protein